MTERVCQKCGAPMAASASFCPSCDTFVDWHLPPAPAAADAPATDTPEAPPPPPPEPQDQVAAPAVSVRQSEIVVAPETPGTFEIAVRNESTIVDSFTIQVVDPPSWLSVTHGEANLLPGVVSTVPVTFAVAPGAFAEAQRTPLSLVVRSSVAPARSASVAISVMVPRSGPAATVLARPNLIRLHDAGDGTFELHIDNRAANFSRQYRLAATDAEGVVRFDLDPTVVDVPAGGSAEATVRFAAPAPPPGEELSRQVTVSATDEDGQISVPVTIAQATSAEPESLPIRVRLEPARVSMPDTGTATLNVVFDNRGGHEQAKLTLSGRDPECLVGFRFDHSRIAVRAGSMGYAQLVVETPTPPRGETVERPISVVAVADDGSEVVADGTLEVSSCPPAISTAALHVHPEHLVVTGRKGTFTVDVDNRRGGEPLNVHLSGADEYGRARIRFRPATIAVPPGQVRRASAVIEHPRPTAGSSDTRRVQVIATAGVEHVTGEAVFTQHTTNRRKVWAISLVLLGALLIVAGVLVWATSPALSGLEGAVRAVADDAAANRMPETDAALTAGTAALLALLLLCAALMLLGLTSTTGRLVRTAAILAACAGVGVVFTSSVVAGLPLVVGGAALAFVGGVLLRP